MAAENISEVIPAIHSRNVQSTSRTKTIPAAKLIEYYKGNA